MEIAASTGDSKDERGLEEKILTDCAAICFDSIILPVIESQVTDPNPVPGANPSLPIGLFRFSCQLSRLTL
jgi:hypothetical protein